METVTPAQFGLPWPSAAQKLTSLDMNLPRVYGARWILCFPLSSGADRAVVLENLRAGLARTILSIPWIAGHVVRTTQNLAEIYNPWHSNTRGQGPEEASDADENRVQIVDSSDGVLFRYKDLTGVLPSYAELKEQDFPLRHLPSDHIFPVGVMPDAPALVFAAQANFLEGGLLLTVAIHHAAGDAVALQTILDVWAQNVSAAGGAGAFTSYNKQSNDRSVLMEGEPPADLFEFPEYVLRPTPKPDPSAPPPAFQMPPMETRLFRFPAARLAGLKADAAAYSTHDALGAFLWCAVMRARANAEAGAAPALPEPTSAFAYSVNIRPRARPPLPPTYMGNASMLGLTGRLPVEVLAGADGVARAAAAIRASLRRFQAPERVPQTIGLLGARRDPTDYKMAYHAFLGPDLVATSWADISVYGTSWGTVLGTPEAFRGAGDGADGAVIILPRREDGGLDVQLGLESSAMAKLLADEDFLRKAVVQS